MNIKLPPTVQDYVDASNQHDVASTVSCFSDDAIVHDEGQTLRGRKAIESWIVRTIEKYKFQFKPIGVTGKDSDVVVAMEVSGPFDGSPVTPDYRFTTASNKILVLTID